VPCLQQSGGKGGGVPRDYYISFLPKGHSFSEGITTRKESLIALVGTSEAYQPRKPRLRVSRCEGKRFHPNRPLSVLRTGIGVNRRRMFRESHPGGAINETYQDAE